MNSEKLQLALCGLMPPSFFKSKKVPVAPLRAANLALLFDFSVAAAAFGALFAYYYNITTPVTTVSSTLLPGQTCTALTPRRGTVFYSANTSENGQFASPFYTKAECIALLQKERQVCAASNRYDFLSVLGVSNPGNTRYFQSGYLTFTPSQAAGVSTELATLYQPSVSFPRPSVSEQFVGSSTAWYVYSYARDSYSEYTDVYLTNPIIDSNYGVSPLGNSEKLYLQNGVTSFAFTEQDVSHVTNGSAIQSQIPNNIAANTLLTINGDDFYRLDIAALFQPSGLAVDESSNVYIADYGNNLIRRIDAVTGAVTSLGASASPRFKSPQGVAVDGLGNVYVADTRNNLVRKIDSTTGIVSVIGVSASPSFRYPNGVAVDGSGNVYVADTRNRLVRRIDAVTGDVTTLGASASPAFSYPSGVAVDGSDNVYVADNNNNLVRRIDAITGNVTSLGTSATPSIIYPFSVAVDGSGNVYVIDQGNRLVRRIDAITGAVTSLAVSTSFSFKSLPPGVAADRFGNVYVADDRLVRRIDNMTAVTVTVSPQFNSPYGVAVDGSGNVYIAETGKSLIHRIDAVTGAVTTLGASASPAFSAPNGVAVDGSGNVYVADSYNNLVRRIDATTGVVTTLGASASPAFSAPYGVAVDGYGNVYVADSANNLVRFISTSTGTVTNLGASASPKFSYPYSLAVDGSGNVYVADVGNSLVRRIDAVTGLVTNLGTTASPTFNGPHGVVVDGLGNVYVGDSGNNLVRRIDSITGAVTSLATSSNPYQVALDSSGNVYVAGNNVQVILVNPQTLGTFWNPPLVIQTVKSPSSTKKGNFTVFASIPTVDQLFIMYAIDIDNDCKTSYRPLSSVVCTNTVVFSLFNDRYQVMLTGFAYNYAMIVSQLTRQPVYVAALSQSNASSAVDIPPNSSGPLPYVYFDASGAVATTVVGVFDTPKGTVLFTTYAPQPVSLIVGNLSDADIAGDLYEYYTYLDDSMTHLNSFYKNFISLIRSSSSVQASVLPGKPSRYVTLQLVLSAGGGLKTVTYDTFTDQYFTASVPINAAATKYMLAYTYGVCNGVLTKSLVELSGSLDYSVECTEQNGLYYQSPNVYYTLPLECVGIPHDKLLTQCPSVTANMQSLVNATCEPSIEKVCETQYDKNPPYTCVGYTRSSILTVLSLSFSTTMAIIGIVAVLLTIFLTLIYPDHTASNEPHVQKEVILVNTGLSKRDAIGFPHEEHEGVMKFCDEVAMRFGLEMHHRAAEANKDEANDDEKSLSPPLKSPEPSSKDTSTQSTVIPINATAAGEPVVTSHQESSDPSSAKPAPDIQIVKPDAVESSYEPLEIGIMSDNFNDE